MPAASALNAVASEPIVYLGPSLSRREAQAALPGCCIRPPIRRGNLYRDRILRSSVFVILDGVFFQQEAISPREVIDVVRDGALVVGACSLGAVRAAECWPAGMRGLGSIYRLFRRGILLSDDEVALAFEPGGSYRSFSVPLINVRYALRHAVRKGRLSRRQGEDVLQTAQETFYSQRNWPSLLAQAGIDDSAEVLPTFLKSFDLKRRDALLALRTVARWLASDPGLADRPRCRDAVLLPSEMVRERDHDALSGADPKAIKRCVGRWLAASGRYLHYLTAVVAADPELVADSGNRSTRTIDGVRRFLRSFDVFNDRQAEAWLEHRGHRREDLEREAGLQAALGEPHSLDAATLAERLWAHLAFSGDLDAEIFRWRAIRGAAREARRLGWRARSTDCHLAEAEIAHAHGYRSWLRLRESRDSLPVPWAEIVRYRDDLALAKRTREHLFNPQAGRSTSP